MPPITDLLTEKTLLRLASPRAFLDGASTAEHGSVEFYGVGRAAPARPRRGHADLRDGAPRG